MKKKTNDDTISVPHHELRPAVRNDPAVALRNVDSNEVFHLNSARPHFTIGTDSECEIVLDDPYVSKRHCALVRRGDRLVIRDLESKNGVLLDRNRVREADVRAGSELRLGKTTLDVLSHRALHTTRVEDQLIGQAPAFLAAIDLAKRVARSGASDCSVLVLGETGTGKELIAQLIHESSPRANGPFVTLNCGGLTSSLIASELFGHMRGAFTDATHDRPGVFSQADGGTLFLDELGELPPDQQPHLLRALEAREVRPIGSTSCTTVDVHFIAATNRLDLASSRTMRSDLYHRVSTVIIALPPLRARRGDIPLLVEAFVASVADPDDISIPPTTMRALETYPWPGNVRELRHAVTRAVTLSPDKLDLAAFLPEFTTLSGATSTRPKPSTIYDSGVRSVLEAALNRHGSVRRAARALGIPKSTFADRARRHGIKLA